MHTTRRFTLIELLTVIAIIAVLMGILLPGIAMVQKKAKITQARGDMQSLLTAIKMYETTYGYLPVAAGANDLLMDYDDATPYVDDLPYDQLIAMLSQTDIPGTLPADLLAPTGNLRGIRMLEVSRAGEFKDPWGVKYNVVIDANYNGSIDGQVKKASDNANVAVRGMAIPPLTITSSVLIWSRGPDGKMTAATSTGDDDTPNNALNKDNIYSVQTNWAASGGHVLR